jgi:hypothetical protein
MSPYLVPASDTGTGDEPFISAPSAQYSAVSANFTADMYLMFKPSTGLAIEVPIKVVPWYWTGSARWNGAKWVETSGYNVRNPMAQITHALPTWKASNKHPWNPPL